MYLVVRILFQKRNRPHLTLVSVKWPILNLILEISVNVKDDTEAIGEPQDAPSLFFPSSICLAPHGSKAHAATSSHFYSPVGIYLPLFTDEEAEAEGTETL